MEPKNEELKRIAEGCESHILCIQYEVLTDEEMEDLGICEDDIYDDIGNWINDCVLDISREQYYSSGEWVTKGYTLVTGTGGPHCEFNTNGEITVYWGGESYTYYMCSDARSIVEDIEEYLNEVF